MAQEDVEPEGRGGALSGQDALYMTMTSEVRQASMDLMKDLEFGFPPGALEEAARDPYYFIGRREMPYVSDMLVEPGLWRRLTELFYGVKRYYVDYVVEYGGQKRREVADRVLLLRLKSSLRSCRTLQIGRDKWESDITRWKASQLGQGILQAMLGSLYYTQGLLETQRLLAAEDVVANIVKGGTSWGSDRLGSWDARHGRALTRHYTRQLIGHPRPYHLGSLTFFDVLSRSLYLQDQIHPLNPDLSKLYTILTPTNTKNEYTHPWTISSKDHAETAIALLGKCIGEQPNLAKS
ncbi:hypothetical protein GNI_180220 [Gregarina niphandrodes]|uniref:Uncharacterized protein n=1 Tax=Gregarina niphandrodes TaxID=110365 RepID=A0A023AWX7_GRENI|nr:hypothetical protein GNI_180220 [Gregarina niphandrodes]EZG43251.1 hypothetical protein GNI_180220 [Gregarina niphandrodes]|eukprot:XP_011133491.1 hypothetical protein GNI_180220 [Gregarina niphandrodes]